VNQILGAPRRARCRGAVGSAVLFSALAVACASNGDVGSSAAPAEIVAPGATVTGNYLAARHARVAGDEADAATFLMGALDEAPGDRVLLGRAYLALTLGGRVSEAVEIARQYNDVDEGTALSHIIVAVGSIHDGAFDAAAAELRSVPQSPLSLFLLPVLEAWTEVGRGNADAAVAELDPLRANPSTTPLYDVHAAWLSDALGNNDAAVRHTRDAIASQPEPWLRLAVLGGALYERAGAKDEAASLYESYLDRHPDSHLLDSALARLKSDQPPPPRDIASAKDGAAEGLFDAAGIVGRQDNREMALALGQLGLYLRPNFPALQLLVGDILESSQRYADANEVYASIDPAHPLAATARLGIARNLERMNRDDEAAALLRQMAEERLDDPDPLSELGDLLRRHDRYTEAVQAYDEAIERLGPLQPRHWRLLYARGIALERSKQWPRAEADFLQALTFEPEQPFVLNYLGYSWVEQGRNLDQAETMIRKAAAMRPDDGYIVDSLGWVLFRRGHYDEAVVHLERAVELRPADPAIIDHLGDAYWSVGRQREARFQWAAALASDPEDDLKLTIEQKLAQGPLRAANTASQ
jgi:tetratricopeptide (TPR) repeat protein